MYCTYVHTISIPLMQGVYARGIQGNASSSMALFYKDIVQPLAEVGCAFIRAAEHTSPILEFIGYSQRAKVMLMNLKEFMRDHIYPAEPVRLQSLTYTYLSNSVHVLCI